MEVRRGISRRTAATVVVLVLQLAACAAALLVPPDGSPHGARIAVSGPPIVASSLADQANRLPGHPLHAGAADSAGSARSDVETGRVVAALVVDLGQNRATLLVSSAQGPLLVDRVSRVAADLARPFAATIETRDVAPISDGSSGQTGLALAIACAVVAGMGIAVAVTWWRGPAADEWSDAAQRVAVTLVAAGVVSSILAAFAARQVDGSLLGWWIVVLLTMLATCAATLALESVLGVAGIGVAMLVLVVVATPLARAEHPLLLAGPWRAVTPWLPHGAGLEAARHVAWFDGAGETRPLAVLVSWLVGSCVVLAIARRERRRAGVSWAAQVVAGRGASRSVAEPDGTGAR